MCAIPYSFCFKQYLTDTVLALEEHENGLKLEVVPRLSSLSIAIDPRLNQRGSCPMQGRSDVLDQKLRFLLSPSEYVGLHHPYTPVTLSVK